MSGPRFAGIDGGGTKTAIVVVDENGVEIARDQGTTSNAAVVGHDKAGATLRGLIQSVAAMCDSELPFAAIWCGLSGSDRPEDHARLRPRIEDLASQLIMTNDAELAIGGLPNRVGVAMVSGTGSIAFGRNAEGVRVRAGGWGHIYGDEGSGYDMARQALRAFTAEVDGYGPTTSLTPRIMEYYQLHDPFSLISHTYDPKTTKGDLARLSRLVVDEARKGDDVANAILDTTARDLALYADAVGRRLGLGPQLDLALVGGNLIHVEPFRQRVLDTLRANWTLGHIALVEDPALTAARSLAADWKGTSA